jgi:hypothetical protein
MILYHISPNASLPGTLYPRQPAESSDDWEGCDTDENGEVIRERYNSECAPDRVSFSETLLGCLQATFAWNYKYFGEEVPPDSVAEFYVYQPDFKSSKRWLSPEEINKAGYTWDAIFTREWISLDPVKVKRVGIVKYHNGNIDCIKVLPFMDKRYKDEYAEICPKEIKIEFIPGNSKVIDNW